ncbi:MAG: hypothetical protein CSA65_03380 [Proteobacteria bacterium]|nr:MAG: hypothetical protein CSB49_05830 [Pseudomonadota bacterium]PIE19094.1 MAG: hypothetical protein CSA65_03380 [Pseudomonadota bacterium]
MRHTTSISLFVGIALALAGGCGGDEGGTRPNPRVKRELPQPVLQMIAPTAVSAGDVVTVFGSGFADDQIGQTRLVFTGVFQSTAGNIEQVNLEVTPTYKNQGMLEWRFGPNIPFSAKNETGTFRGIVQARNIGFDGSQKQATPLSTQVQVRPSILIKQFRPISAGCSPDLKDTTDDTKMLIEVEAVGLKAGNGVAPLRFVYTFMKQHFQFEGFFSGQMGLDPEGLFPQSGPVSIIRDVTDGNTSLLGSGVPSTTYVHQGTPGSSGLSTSVDNMFQLTHLRTAPLANPQANNYEASISIMAIDSTGQSITRTIPLTVWAPVEVDYDGGVTEVESFDPVPVTGCISGGDVGRDVTYSEMTAESRSRSFKVKSEVGGGFNVGVAQLNASFGVEVDGAVTSASSKDLKISGFILPNQFAVFYRQTIQIERVAKLRGHGPCGNTRALGEVVVTDWIWAPDLAKAKSCPPLPPSNLAPGKRFK